MIFPYRDYNPVPGSAAGGGGGGSFIPLSGTTAGNPVTGDIEFDSGLQLFTDGSFQNISFKSIDSAAGGNAELVFLSNIAIMRATGVSRSEIRLESGTAEFEIGNDAGSDGEAIASDGSGRIIYKHFIPNSGTLADQVIDPSSLEVDTTGDINLHVGTELQILLDQSLTRLTNFVDDGINTSFYQILPNKFRVSIDSDQGSDGEALGSDGAGNTIWKHFIPSTGTVSGTNVSGNLVFDGDTYLNWVSSNGNAFIGFDSSPESVLLQLDNAGAGSFGAVKVFENQVFIEGDAGVSGSNLTITDDSIFVGDSFSMQATEIGLYTAAPVARQSVTGSRGGNVALANLLTALHTLGAITDNTTV